MSIASKIVGYLKAIYGITPTSGGGVTLASGLTTTSLNLGGATVLDVLTATATLDFGSIAAGTAEELTISVTGAEVGDAVFLSVPAAGTVNAIYTARVSATNVVTVKCNNNGLLSAIDPASGTFRAVVVKF